MSGGYVIYESDPSATGRSYPGVAYDQSPPVRFQPPPQQQVYPQIQPVYRACNQPPAPPAPAPAPQPTRVVKVIYYDPRDPNFLPPAPLVTPPPAPVAALPAAPRPSYVEMPASGSSNQFREGDMYRVVAIHENPLKAQTPYHYPGRYVEPARRGDPVGYVFYQ